jgi:hypothetical protein
MAVNLSFIGGAGWQFFNDNGVPLAGGKIFTYAAGTTTPLTTYTSRSGTVANTNPIILDAAGRTPEQVWSTEGLLYKYVVKDASNVEIRTWDNIGGSVVASDLAQDLANTTLNVKGDALVGFRQANDSGFLVGSVGRTVSNKLQEFVSAKDFGVVGDGVADDTIAMQNASNAANAVNKRLYVPAGTYKLSNKVLFYTGILGDGKTKTKFQSTGASLASNAILEFAGSGVYEQFWVDGNVSADPVVWNSSNYDSFTGWLGVYVVADDVQIKSARATNTRRGGFNVWDRDNVAFYDCETSRSRGNFGDGFFAYYGVKNVSFINCRAYDFTRIGFVFDGTLPAAAVSRNCAFINCHAEYGHDRSILYGGGEYNSGFWAENCAEVVFDACTAIDTGERGFTIASGQGGTSLLKTPGFVLNNCSAENNAPPVTTARITDAFSISGLNSTVRGAVVLNSCTAKNVVRGFSVSSFIDVTINTCAWYMDGGLTNTWAVLAANQATVDIRNFYQHWINPPASVTSTANDSFTASISAFNDGSTPPCKGIKVDTYVTHDNSPCYLKQRISVTAADANYLVVRNTKLDAPGNAFFSGPVLFENCEVLGGNFQSAATRIFFSGCKFSLVRNLFVSWLDAMESCVFDSCSLTRISNQYIYVYRVNGTTNKFPRVKFVNCSFIGDVASHSYFVRQNAEAPVFNNAGQGHSYVGCVFVNSGGATTNPLINFEATGVAAGSVFMSASWKSSTVTNVVKAGFLQSGSTVVNF